MTEDVKRLDADEDSLVDDQERGQDPAPVESLDGEEISEEDMDDDRRGAKVPISELKKVRSEAAKYRRRLRELEGKTNREKRESELSKMEETDKLKAIATEAETKAYRLKERADKLCKQSAVINAASAIGFHNPKDAASIINIGRIEVDDEGVVDDEKVNELVKSLAESKPYLVRGQQDSQNMVGFGPTNPPSASSPKPKFRVNDQIDMLKQQSNEAMQGGRMADAVRLYNQAWEKERDIKRK